MNFSPVLIMFVRAPYLGSVKQRLAEGIGSVAARDFYRRTVSDVLAAVSKNAPWQIYLFVTPNCSAVRGRFWPSYIRKLPQGYGDLGDRMERALLKFSDRPVVIIGSDIPTISYSHIQKAFSSLGQTDLVFGPSPDGGYWLVGARVGSLARGLFRNVRWSSEGALSDTLINVGARRTTLIDELEDIDDVKDLARWRAHCS